MPIGEMDREFAVRLGREVIGKIYAQVSNKRLDYLNTRIEVRDAVLKTIADEFGY